MTTPASDCGVAAGCGACPLGRAGVCGDPVPDGVAVAPLAVFGNPRDFATPAEWLADGFVRVERGDNGHDAQCEAEFISGPMRWSPCRCAERRAADTPDRDPAEPRPADAGCCGGGCGG